MEVDFERPILTVDIVLLTLIEGRLHVLLATRGPEPAVMAGLPGLIGGYIHTQEDADTHAAARRIVQQKVKNRLNPDARYAPTISHLEQLAMFSGPDRDPRGWSATLAYIAMVQPHFLASNFVRIDSDADFYPVDALPERLAFDHAVIVQRAVERVRNKSSYSTLPLFLLPKDFTMSEAQEVYEGMMGVKIDQANFRRRIDDLVELTGEYRTTSGRNAKLYRAKSRKLNYLTEAI